MPGRLQTSTRPDSYRELSGRPQTFLHNGYYVFAMAGPDAQMAVIKLLRYLKDKYFVAFESDEEGLYWETRDEKRTASQFSKYDYLLKLNAAADTLSDP